jgi:hypothetical protein
VQAFAEGEWLLPTPRPASAGAPKSKLEQTESASLPGTAWPPRAASPKKAPATKIASTKNEQSQSSVFGSPRYTSPPPPRPSSPRASKPKLGPTSSDPFGLKAGRNVSSAFPGQTHYTAPPRPPPREGPPPEAPSTKAQQYASSVFGEPRQWTPREVATPEPYFGRVAPAKEPRRPNASPVQAPYPAWSAAPRPPETKPENQISYVLGGSPSPQAYAASSVERHRLSKSLMRVELNGLPSDANTHRLHQSLIALAYDQGVTCDVNKVKVKYDTLNGRASGKAVAEFRHVPDQDRVMNSISDGCASGTLKAHSARVVYDDRKDTSGERKRDEATNLASRFGKKNASVYRRYDRVV